MLSKKFILLPVLISCSLVCTLATIQADDKPVNASTNSNAAAPTKASGLSVQFTLNRPETNQYRRPYVAVWLEDDENYPVKTAALWLQTEQPGPRWHRDLTRWYRNDRLRKVAEKTDLIDGISGATRGPGDYEAYFDGTDNDGNRLKPGKYKLCIEVAREHGTYQLVRHDFVWGNESFEERSIAGNVELCNINVSFAPSLESQE